MNNVCEFGLAIGSLIFFGWVLFLALQVSEPARTFEIKPAPTWTWTKVEPVVLLDDPELNRKLRNRVQAVWLFNNKIISEAEMQAIFEQNSLANKEQADG